jgi:HlyD family secretion protein
MRRIPRWLIILLAVLGAGGTGAGYLYSHAPWRSKPNFRTAIVTRGQVESVVNSTGTIKPARQVTVGAFASGPIAEIYVDFNSVVKKGDLMARIDPRLQIAAVDRDKAALATQRAEKARIEALLQQAINNEERAKKLAAVNKDYLSDVEMDQYKFSRQSLEAQKQLAEAAIEQAEASLNNSKANLEYTKILAPEDGIIIERKVETGQTVAAVYQTPELFIMAPEMDKLMHVFATVDEADIGLIRAAQEQKRPVSFTVDAYPGELFKGKIFQVRTSATTNQNVVTYPVVIETPNQNMKLMPGMTANITFQIEVKSDVLRLPAAALRYLPAIHHIHPDDRHYLDNIPKSDPDNVNLRPSANEKVELASKRKKRVVWIPGEPYLRAVPVELGLYDNQWAEIAKGELTEGQTVVTGDDPNNGGR